MGCRGVHFAVTDQQRDHLLGLGNDDDRVDYIQGVIEKEAMGGGFEFETVLNPPSPGGQSIFVVGADPDKDELGPESAKAMGSGLVYVKHDEGKPLDSPDDTFAETDVAWDAIHRCLGEFPPDTPHFYEVSAEAGAWALPEDYGSYPLKLCVLGGRRVSDDDSRYIIRLIEPGEVSDLAEALTAITKDWMRDRYFKHCKGAWPSIYGEEDFEFTWEWFERLREFFVRHAPKGQSVIFTVNQ